MSIPSTTAIANAARPKPSMSKSFLPSFFLAPVSTEEIFLRSSSIFALRILGTICTKRTTPTTPKRYAIPWPTVTMSSSSAITSGSVFIELIVSFAAEKAGVEVRAPERRPTAISGLQPNTLMQNTVVRPPRRIITRERSA